MTNEVIQLFKCKSNIEIRNVIEKIFTGITLPEKTGSTILIKLNLNSNMNALTGNTTDLRIVSAVIESLQRRGYTNIIIGEGTSSGFYRNKINQFARLSVDKLAQHYNVKIVDFNYAESVEILFEGNIKAKIPKICLTADFFINIPKIKMHFETMMSVSLKNLIGCLVGLEEKQKTHYSLYKNIIHLNENIHPHLHIVDGLIAMEGTGPSKGTPILLNTIVAGKNPYLIDLVCARIAHVEWESIPVLKIAHEKGYFEQKDLDYVNSLDLGNFTVALQKPTPNLLSKLLNNQMWQKYIIKIRLAPGLNSLFNTNAVGNILNFMGLRQDVFVFQERKIENIVLIEERCNKCGLCTNYCPVSLNLPKAVWNKELGCIECLYCYSICPKTAFKVSGDLGFFTEQIKQYDEIIRTLVK